MEFDLVELLPFRKTLVGFTKEQVQIMRHMPVLTIFRSSENEKTIKVRYLIVNAASPYNFIIGRPSYNTLATALSTFH